MQGDGAPKLAILDWMMPGLDGVEICRRARQRMDAPYVYMMLLTSKIRKEDIIEGMDAGADDYLTKPFNRHELEVRLRAGLRILDLQEALLASADELTEARTRETEMGSAHPPDPAGRRSARLQPGLEVVGADACRDADSTATSTTSSRTTTIAWTLSWATSRARACPPP